MLFNSLGFLIFFPVVTIIYFLLPLTGRWVWLLAASCFFYMFFKPVYILILFLTIAIDYYAGILLENEKDARKKKWWLIMSLIANIGVLAIFKYYNFINLNISSLCSVLRCENKIPFLEILLPIGLSFHTFQAMSYTIEVYRGNQKAERNPVVYALYVMFYPQLVAGPIERPQNILHQLRTLHFFSAENLMTGLRLMLWGFFKKVVIADRLAVYVSEVYSHPADFHYLNLIIATIFFSIQIYCDFSGYSDIAIGCAKVMGIDLMVNFNRPYFSSSIKEFWSKWHISLSTWFRDYLYISLGGNRSGVFKTYINLAIVFLISGLWHGANWTFVMWGAVHACFIVINSAYTDYSPFKIPKNFLTNAVSVICIFCIVTFAWIFFRAANIDSAFLIIKKIALLDSSHAFLLNRVGKVFYGKLYLMLIALLFIVLFTVERFSSALLKEFNHRAYLDILFCSFALTMIIVFGVFKENSFIYFQF